MGDFSEHVLFGAVAGLAALLLVRPSLGFTEAAFSSLMLFAGSIIPDVDHKNSYVFRSVRAFLSLCSAVFTAFLIGGTVQSSFFAGLTGFISAFLVLSFVPLTHRGRIHSFSFAVIAGSIGVILSVFSLGSAVPGVFLGIGVFSHLLLDGELVSL
ncbi:MAG: metal-dependent hydrolase, partial [Candidatus Nanohaloarchaea archaeon]